MAQVTKNFYIEELNTTVEVVAFIHRPYNPDDAVIPYKTEWTIPCVKDNKERLTQTEKLECEIQLIKKLENFRDWGN